MEKIILTKKNIQEVVDKLTAFVRRSNTTRCVTGDISFNESNVKLENNRKDLKCILCDNIEPRFEKDSYVNNYINIYLPIITYNHRYITPLILGLEYGMQIDIYNEVVYIYDNNNKCIRLTLDGDIIIGKEDSTIISAIKRSISERDIENIDLTILDNPNLTVSQLSELCDKYNIKFSI